MLIVESYGIAVAMCVVTMLCWGSWANTQKLASNEWQFQLFYWDYSLGVLLTNWRFANVPRLRAPAAVLNGASTTTTLTVEQNAFHASDDDTSFFAVGDVVSLWYRDGIEVNSPSETRTITAKTATTLTINSGFTSGPSGAIVRLANFDAYGNGGYTSRQYAFLSDEDGLMGPSGDTGDVYG